MKLFRLAAGFAAAVVLVGAVAAAEPLRSGPQVDAKVPGAFEPYNVTGEAAGMKNCLVCQNGENPVVMIFAHEAEHHRNPQAAEAVVECYAIQDIRRVAILFNGTKTFANEAALLARDVAYPRQYASYRTRACRAGGPLDRTPGDGRWP